MTVMLSNGSSIATCLKQKPTVNGITDTHSKKCPKVNTVPALRKVLAVDNPFESLDKTRDSD
jgi:hypothetical protein